MGIDRLVEFLARWEPFDRMYLDIAGGQVLLASLQRYSPGRIYPAVKDRHLGLNLYAGLFADLRLTHHVSNENTIEESTGIR